MTQLTLDRARFYGATDGTRIKHGLEGKGRTLIHTNLHEYVLQRILARISVPRKQGRDALKNFFASVFNPCLICS